MGGKLRGGKLAYKTFGTLSAGVRGIWIVDPGNRTIAVHTVGADVAVLCAPDALEGGDIVHGFRYPVAELFASVGPD